MTSFVAISEVAGSKSTMPIQLTICGDEESGFTWFYSKKHLIVGSLSFGVKIKLKNKTNFPAVMTSFACSGISESHKPINSFEVGADGNSASFKVSLLKNQIVNFGVFVSLTLKNGSEAIIFCDPQASNDPIKDLRPI